MYFVLPFTLYIQYIVHVPCSTCSDGLSVLAEMFPKACSLEIEHCLMVANGDTESAAQLLLLKNENNDEEEKENCHGIVDLSPKVGIPSVSIPLQ